MAGVEAAMGAFKPHLLLTLGQLSLAVYMALLQAVLDPARGLSAIVLVVYETIIAASVVSFLAFFLERRRRPKFSFSIVAWAFLIGSLEVPLGQLMMTASLRYVTATFQSVALNMIPVVVFILALVCRRESFWFCSVHGQAKLWGVLISAAGATVMVVMSNSESRSTMNSHGSPASGWWVLGCLMNGAAVLATATASLLVETVSMKYPAVLTLTAMVNVFGTLQTTIAAALMERNPSSWCISWSRSLQLFTILYGGIIVTGISFWVHVWCIHKKGPLFTTAFSPLLIVFSYILATLIRRSIVRLESIIGALLVIGGLYLLLWAKTKDKKQGRITKWGKGLQVEDLSVEPLLPCLA